MSEGYKAGYGCTWVILFIGLWIYAIQEYGWFWGGGLGWLPAAVIAAVASLFWPLYALAILAVIGLIIYGNYFSGQ